MRGKPNRTRLPNRRPAETVELEVDGQLLIATVGFDAQGRPAEIFLSGAKDGSALAAILADAAVVISVALQHGVPAAALSKSSGRAPTSPRFSPKPGKTPSGADGTARPASVIAAALDLLASYPVELVPRPEFRYRPKAPA